MKVGSCWLSCGARIELAIGSLPKPRKTGTPTAWLRGDKSPWDRGKISEKWGITSLDLRIQGPHNQTKQTKPKQSFGKKFGDIFDLFRIYLPIIKAFDFHNLFANSVTYLIFSKCRLWCARSRQLNLGLMYTNYLVVIMYLMPGIRPEKF